MSQRDIRQILSVVKMSFCREGCKNFAKPDVGYGIGYVMVKFVR